MSEARELFEALADQLKKLAHLHVTKGNRDVAAALSNTRNAIAEALATHPEPGAVPELPDWVGALVLAARDALDRLEDSERDAGEEYEEAIALRAALAARERARRAQS